MKFSVRCVAFAVCACALSVFMPGCKKPLAQRSLRLDNGLRVDLLATPRGDKAALVVLFDVGADHDPPGRSGMAHLVEHLYMSSREQAGFERHSRTSADYTMFGAVIPAGRVMDEIDGAALRMTAMTVTEADLARERPRVLAEIAQTQERDPIAAAMHRAAEALQPTRGSGQRGGVASEVEAMTPGEVEAFRRAAYGAGNARLLIAGRFSIEEAVTRVRAAFDKVPAGKPPQPRPPAYARVTGTLVMGDAPRAMALAVPVPEPKDPLYPAFLVLAARVTAPGGAARTWSADFAPLARPDVLFVTSPLPQGPAPEAAASRMRDEVNAIVGAPLASDEAARAVDKFGGELGIARMQPETASSEPFELAFAAGRRAQMGIDTRALGQAAGAVTQQQVAAAAKLFDAKSSAAVIAGGKL